MLFPYFIYKEEKNGGMTPPQCSRMLIIFYILIYINGKYITFILLLSDINCYYIFYMLALYMLYFVLCLYLYFVFLLRLFYKLCIFIMFLFLICFILIFSIKIFCFCWYFGLYCTLLLLIFLNYRLLPSANSPWKNKTHDWASLAFSYS